MLDDDKDLSFMQSFIENAVENIEKTGGAKRVDILLSDEGLTNCPSPFSSALIDQIVANTKASQGPISIK